MVGFESTLRVPPPAFRPISITVAEFVTGSLDQDPSDRREEDHSSSVDPDLGLVRDAELHEGTVSSAGIEVSCNPDEKRRAGGRPDRLVAWPVEEVVNPLVFREPPFRHRPEIQDPEYSRRKQDTSPERVRTSV